MSKLFFILLFFSTTCTGQEKKLEINLDVRKSSVGTYFTYSIFNKERTKVCILASGTENIKGYVLNQDYQLLHEFTTDKASASTILVGGYFSGDKINFLLGEHEDDNFLSHYEYDPVTQKSVHAETRLDMKKAMYIGAMSLGDQFLYIGVKKKEDKITIYRFGKKTSRELLEFSYPAKNIDEPGLLDAFSEVVGFSRVPEIACITDWESAGLDKVKNYSKLYFRNDSVFITIDKSPVRTRVLSLGLDQQEITSREIKRDFDLHMNISASANSFLLGNQLYSIASCADALQLTIHDFYTGSILKQFVTGKNEEISFRNTDILQEGTAFFSDDDKKLEKTRQLLRKMTNGRAILIARNSGHSEVELTIGSYALVQNNSGGGGTWIAGAPGSSPVYISYPGFSRQWIKSARFKTLLQTNNFEKTSGQIQMPLEEKIEKFTKGIKIPLNCEGIYPSGNKLHYYYLDKKAKKIVVYSL